MANPLESDFKIRSLSWQLKLITYLSVIIQFFDTILEFRCLVAVKWRISESEAKVTDEILKFKMKIEFVRPHCVRSFGDWYLDLQTVLY